MLQTRLPYLSQKRPGRWQFNAQNINKVVSDVCSCCTKTKLIKTINSRSSSIVILNVEQLRRWQWLLLAFLLLVVFIGTGIGIGSNIIINLINVAIMAMIVISISGMQWVPQMRRLCATLASKTSTTFATNRYHRNHIVCKSFGSFFRLKLPRNRQQQQNHAMGKNHQK